MAAFNWAAHWFSLESPQHVPDRDRLAHALAGARYELEKLKAAGSSVEDARKQGAELTKAHANGDELTDLYAACGLAHAKDSEFRRQYPRLLAWAQSEAARYPTHH